MIAASVSRGILPLFDAPELLGIAAGGSHLEFGGEVVVLTAPGSPRMPNGVETAIRAFPRDLARIGLGRLVVGALEITAGTAWEPIPHVGRRPIGGPDLRPDPDLLAGRGPGLTPAGDDILCGYMAGLVLFHGRSEEAAAIALAARPRTTRFSASLLRHAAVGELPEPAHAFLAHGDPVPLSAFGHSSGPCLRLGLVLAAGDLKGRAAGLAELLELAGVAPDQSLAATHD